MEGIQHLVPTFDGCDDLVGIGGPGEGLGLLVVLDEEAVDGGLKVNNGMKDAAFQTSFRQLGEEALDGVEPGAGGRREVEREALVAVEPCPHLGMLVGSIVVEDDMHGLARRNLCVDGIEEADELLMAMALHVPADDGAVEHIKGGEQGGCAVALVIVRHGAEPPLFHRQAGLGAVERLDLALLVNRQHDGVGRRIDIEADDVAQLVDEFGIVGELELTPAMRLEAMRLPDTPDRAGADAGSLRHHVGGPMRRLARRIGKRQRHHTISDRGAEWRNPRRPRLVAQQPVVAFCGKAFLPAPHAGLRLAGPTHDLGGADAIGGQKHDLGAPDMLLWGVAVPDQCRQAGAIDRRNGERYSCAHAPDSHVHNAKGIPQRTLMLGGNH